LALQDVEQCLTQQDPVAALLALHVDNIAQLADLTAMARGKLSPLERKVWSSTPHASTLCLLALGLHDAFHTRQLLDTGRLPAYRKSHKHQNGGLASALCTLTMHNTCT
jgi:hypothetical protein